MIIARLVRNILGLSGVTLLSSCAWMSQTGPQKADILNAGDSGEHPPYRVIEVNSRADLPRSRKAFGQGEIPLPVQGESYSDKVRTRDFLTFIITDLNEQSPFFSGGSHFTFGPIEVPATGIVSLPYIGELNVIGIAVADISKDLEAKLKPISSAAQASVAISKRLDRTANVIGEVRNPGPIPLVRANFTSVDLLAASGGPAEAEHLFKYTYRRNGRDYIFDYQGFRKKSFPVEEGDLLNVTTDTSNRFYVMGAINKPTTVAFPVAAPTLADALGAATGLDVSRADPSGVFIFRKGNPDKVYIFNMKRPEVVFLTQRFEIEGEDLVYITEAPLARWSRLIGQLIPLSQSLSQSLFNVQRASTL